MKHLVLLCALVVSVNIYGQTEPTSLCDKYRDIMVEGMDEMGFDSTSRKYIIGFKGEYFNVGMSENFSSEPKVPEFMLTDPNINSHMVKIVTAHVDLYHCDLAEKEIFKIRKSVIINEEPIVSIFPNPTSGMVKIESTDVISNIIIFNMTGSLLQRYDKSDKLINLSNFSKGIYLLQISTDKTDIIQKIILE